MVATDAPAQAPPYGASLTITGPDWRSSLARNGRVVLSQPEIHIGLLKTNEIALSDPVASRIHAVIHATPNGYVLQDAGSKAGTTVDGQRIAEPVLLVPGQHIHIGNTDLLFEVVPAPAPPGTPPAEIAPSLPAAPARESWLKRQARKYYWRVFLIGLAGYIAATVVLNATDNGHMVPLSLLLGASIAPVAFVVFCWEESAFADIPATVVGFSFVSGAILGLVLAAALEPWLVIGAGFGAAFMVGLVEESAKGIAAAWFLRDRRLDSELDGLIVGAATGMGFAALETAGYGFARFLVGFIDYAHDHYTIHESFVHGLGSMEDVIALRMVLAIFGHGTWTAIFCAALWRERGPKGYRLTVGVVLAFAIAVLLHALWDTSVLFLPFVALLGILILRFFIKESVARARLGKLAPPPPPLAGALGAYLRHPFRSGRDALPPSPALATALTNAAPVPPALPSGTSEALPAEAATAQPVQAPPTTVHCPHCSRENPAEARFCAACGTPLQQSGGPPG